MRVSCLPNIQGSSSRTPTSMPGMRAAILFRADHNRAVTRLQRQIAAGMIGMMMGVDDVGELAFAQRPDHRVGLGGVHHRPHALTGIGNQIGVIVPQTGN